ncbi:MAG TPA: hypothetical protein VMY05_00115 [Acidobacteriota bacterium]|nr:hypothetical protein [Acidobacteriota bacterium]
MTRIICLLMAAVPLTLAAGINAQGLIDGPESVAFDSLNNRYLVSSLRNSTIISIDTAGAQDAFYPNLGVVAGNCIVGNTLYVTARPDVVGIDLTTREVVMHLSDKRWQTIDGLTADTSGNLYVLETIGAEIYKIRLSDNTYSEFVMSGITSGAQDLFFDERHNRILICTWVTAHPIQSISLEDSTVTTLLSPTPGFFDGITMDQNGFVYAGSYMDNAVYMWDSTYSNPPIRISTGHTEPAGLDYNRRDDILAVPNFGGDRVDFVKCNVPSLRVSGCTLDDSGGDGDGRGDPGESGELAVILGNKLWEGQNVAAELTSLDPNVTVVSSTVQFGTCAGWGQRTVSGTSCALEIDDACPVPRIAPLEIAVTAGGGYEITDTAYLFIGDTTGFADQCESGAGFWRHWSATVNSADEWHLDDYRAHSGDYSWKVGGAGSTPYAHTSDGALVSPPLLLPPEARLSFWHWMEAEQGGGEGSACDAGVVMISADGGEWQLLTPVDGYTHTRIGDLLNPLPAGTPCFSGSLDWTQAEFDLAAYSGVVRLMFRFITDAGVSREGWYIDDIEVYPAGCCLGETGNIDGDPEEIVDIGDLTTLISYLFISQVEPACMEEANTDGDIAGVVDIGDLTKLISYLFISYVPPAACQ